ncbi:hypothetical protein KD4_41660 (plasmid) [Yersinia pseudotuberculosis]
MKEIAKRVHRIYCLLKLNIRRKGKQRLPACNPSPLAVPERLNLSGSVDFMHNAQCTMHNAQCTMHNALSGGCHFSTL